MNKVTIEVLKKTMSGKSLWTRVSQDLIARAEASTILQEYKRQYPKNTYRITAGR